MSIELPINLPSSPLVKKEVISSLFILMNKPSIEEVYMPSPIQYEQIVRDFKKKINDTVAKPTPSLPPNVPNYDLIYLVIGCYFLPEEKQNLEKLKIEMRSVDIEALQILFHNLTMTLATQVFQENVKIKKNVEEIRKPIKNPDQELINILDPKEEEDDYTELNMLNLNDNEFENTVFNKQKFVVEEVSLMDENKLKKEDGLPDGILDEKK